MFHRMTVEWPCLTLDVVRDTLGHNRTRFPMTSYVVAGSQADRPENNVLYCMKMSDLHRTRGDGLLEDDVDDDEGADDDNNTDDDPVLQYRVVPHPDGAVNRIRMSPHYQGVAVS